jgi:hypothetical protein
MGDVIDLTLVSNARRYFQKLLDTRGLNYFLRKVASSRSSRARSR